MRLVTVQKKEVSFAPLKYNPYFCGGLGAYEVICTNG